MIASYRYGEPVSRKRLVAADPLQPIRPSLPWPKTGKNSCDGRCCRHIAGVSEAEAPVGVEPTMADLQSAALATWLRSRIAVRFYATAMWANWSSSSCCGNAAGPSAKRGSTGDA